MSPAPRAKVPLGVEENAVCLPLDAIVPLREVPASVRKSAKYAQIAASIAEIGLVEPPVVARDAEDRDRYHLLDGHLRVAILRERQETEVVCLVAIDDEAFTYNKHVSRIATIQEHKMILKALDKGVTEERLARALNVNIASIRTKRKLLAGICPEVAELLRDRHVPINTFTELRSLKPLRQIEVAQATLAMNCFKTSYVRSLVAATPTEQRAEGRRRRVPSLSETQIKVMQGESENLSRELRQIEQSYSSDHLDLVLAIGYIKRLLGSARVVRYLAQNYAAILAEFQKLSELESAV